MYIVNVTGLSINKKPFSRSIVTFESENEAVKESNRLNELNSRPNMAELKKDCEQLCTQYHLDFEECGLENYLRYHLQGRATLDEMDFLISNLFALRATETVYSVSEV